MRAPGRAAAARHLEEGKKAIDRTSLSRRVFDAKAVGPRLHVLA